MAIDEVIDVEQVVVLNLGDAGRRAGHALHRLVVAADVVEPLGREDLERRRQREIVRAAQLGLIDDALAAGAEQLEQLQVVGPVQPPLGENVLVLIDQLVGLMSDRVAAVRDRCIDILPRRGEHAVRSCDEESNAPPEATHAPRSSM